MTLRPCATRCIFPNTTAGTDTYMCRTHEVCRGGVTQISVGWVNAIANITGEQNTGGTLTVSGCSIEYPAGVFTRVKFSGSNSTTITDGTRVVSDVTTVTIPDGADFWVIGRVSHSSALPYSGNHLPLADNANGDAVEWTTTDKTMTGGIVDDGNNLLISPVTILGDTTAVSIGIIGDSRAIGFSETAVDSRGCTGEIARAVSSYAAVLNYGSFGEPASSYIASHVLRSVCIDECTYVVCEYGINDLGLGATAATVEGRINTIASYYAGKFFATTLPPETTGAWTLANHSDQTKVSWDDQRTAYNNWLRALPTGIRCVEIADYVESARDSGYWKADGTVGKYTLDGVHESTFANQQIVISAGVLFSPAIVGFNGTTDTGASATSTVTNPGSAGQMLIVVCNEDAGGSVGTISLPSGWVEQYKTNFGGDGANFYIWYVISNDGSANYTFGGTGQFSGFNRALTIMAVVGVDQTTPVNAFDKTLNAASVGTFPENMATPSITTTVDGCLLVYGGGPDLGAARLITMAAPSGFTNPRQDPDSSTSFATATFLASQIQAALGSSGAKTGTVSVDSPTVDGFIAFLLALAPITGGGGGGGGTTPAVGRPPPFDPLCLSFNM